MTRPLGQQRGVAAVIVFSILTLGIYNLYWQFKTFQELKDYSGQGIGGGLAIVLALFLGIVNWFILPSEVGSLYLSKGEAAPVSGVTGCWNFLPFVGTIVWFVKVQGAMNRFWAAQSQVQPSPVGAMI